MTLVSLSIFRYSDDPQFRFDVRQTIGIFENHCRVHNDEPFRHINDNETGGRRHRR